jgi:hypothetical protein
MLEDQLNTIIHESDILRYRTEGVWCENFYKYDSVMQAQRNCR